MPSGNKPLPFGPHWLERRQTGLPSILGTAAVQANFFYKDLNVTKLYESPVENGIFCVEFNPKGSLIVTACENKSILMFDPLNPKPVQTLENAHMHCVNGVKFLGSHLFATCSDDHTAALWDLRNLRSKIYELKGHRSWVKSIDYVPETKNLITSGFDGSIISWNIMNAEILNCSSFGTIAPNEIFKMNGLMRSCLTPDGSKLIISTSAGYIIIVHNFDASKLKEDLKNFKPNMCRLMQMSQEHLMTPADSSELFANGKRNRVEFICDFPADAEVIASVQVHPEGHSVLSRNTSKNESSEWTCVHTIEENFEESNRSNVQPWSLPSFVHKSISPTRIVKALQGNNSDLPCNPSDVWEAMIAIEDARIKRRLDPLPASLDHLLSSSRNSTGGILSSVGTSRITPRRRWATVRTAYETNLHVLEYTLRLRQNRYNHLPRVVPINVFTAVDNRGTSLSRQTIAEIRIQGGVESTNAQSFESSSDDDSEPSSQLTTGRSSFSARKIQQNIRRLNYFIEEPNVTHGYIKEPSFSSDGRIICSPYKMGIRLLTFSPELHLPWQCLPDPPPALLHCKWQHEFNSTHPDAVVSTKFSPIDNQIVAGTRVGQILLISPFR